MTMLGVPADRVTNTYQTSALPTLSPEVATAGGLASWLEGLFDLQPGNYLLYYGALEPEKNIGRIIEAFLGLRVTMPLVIVGGRAWKSENELRLLQPGPDGNRVASGRNRVRQLEFLPAAWLSGLVRGARAVVFPSLSEEFGLPMLEAMQAGVPVLTSREGSLAEIGGDAVLLVDAYDPAAIGAAMERIATDDALSGRLATAGLVQATHFDADAYRNRLARLYAATMAAPVHAL